MPATSSVTLASQACNTPGFMPRLWNHRPVPGIFPPRHMWFTPWATIVPPTATRRMSNPRFT